MGIRSLLVLYVFLILCMDGQALGNKGRAFLVGVMDSYCKTYGMFLLVISDQLANVTVNAPFIGMNATYQTVEGFLTVFIKRELVNVEVGKRAKGIFVRADADISLYFVSDCSRAPDSSMILPLPELGTRYIAGMYSVSKNGLDKSEILIIASDNETSINITLRGNVSIDGQVYRVGDLYTLQLSEYETFFLQSTDDLTGTEIRSSRPVAVLSGNRINGGKYGLIADHIEEQIPPVDSLGTNFIALPFYSSAVTYITIIRAVSVHENTEVCVQGRRLTILNIGEYVDYETLHPVYIKSSKPILLLEIAEIKPGGAYITNGDPSMIVLQSLSHFSTDYLFSLVNSNSQVNNFTEHYLAVTIESDHQLGILLDGENVNPNHSFNVIGPDGSSNFSLLVYKMSTPGRHRLRHTLANVTFGAVVYGAGEYASYAHQLGFKKTGTECEGLQCGYDGNLINTTLCDCLTGWQGKSCLIDINECLNSPCEHGGNCTNTNGSYSCDCPIGWQGKNCSKGINYCLSSPCEHGGNCTNTNGTYSCDCPIGWQGKDCSTDVNECQEIPCENGGNCTNTEGSYLCSSPTVWQGQNCAIDINQLPTTSYISTSFERHPSSSGTSGSTEELTALRAVVGSLAGLLVISILLTFWFIRKSRRMQKENKKERQRVNPRTTEDQNMEYADITAAVNTEITNMPQAFGTTSTRTALNGSLSEEQGYTTLTSSERTVEHDYSTLDVNRVQPNSTRPPRTLQDR